MGKYDLGPVVGPQGPQGATGPQGAAGPQGPAGPNEITGSTATTLSGVLAGNGSTVGAKTVDSAPDASHTGNLISSAAVASALTSKANMAQLAAVETGSTASRAYAVGEYLCLNGILYSVTADIASGGAITPNTNVAATNVGEKLSGLSSLMHRFNVQSGKKVVITASGANKLFSILVTATGASGYNGVYHLSGYGTNASTHFITTISAAENVSVVKDGSKFIITHASGTAGFRVASLTMYDDPGGLSFALEDVS